VQYNKIIKLCEGLDYVTQDMVTEILGEEEEHRREFIGFLKEYEKK
jgi:bacterioferritin